MKYFIFCFLIVCVACKSESASPSTETLPEVPNAGTVKTVDTEVLLVEDLKAHPWHVEIVLDNGNIEKNSPLTASVITFMEDSRYTWTNDGKNEKGKFNLDPEKNIILLTADDPKQSSEWSIKHRRSNMVWIGTPKFSHHSMQLKLIKK